jgi:dihydrofolate synthase/folylpolyglutamate synthase
VDPLVSVITEIDWDHQNHLGDTLAKIAFEKAGIIKPGRPVITGVAGAEPLGVIRNAARERRSMLWRVGEEICVERTGARAVVRTPRRKVAIQPSLLGRFQFKNAAMAIAAIDAAAIPVSDSDVEAGIHTAWLPGRLQIVRENPKVVLDGAHNPQSARETASALRTFRLVYSCTKGHDPAAVLNEFRAGAAAVYLCQMSSERGMAISEIEAAAVAAGMKFEAFSSVEEAVQKAVEQSRPADTVLVSGSFYHLGEARRAVCGT